MAELSPPTPLRRTGLAPAVAAPAAAVPAAIFVFATALVIYFHNRFWWPPDEGAYAYVAARILAGDTLNGTIQDLHAGYINLWHAAMFRMFGEDLVSLRYPLAVMTVGAALLACQLLRPAGRLLAVAAGVAMAVFFFLPFLNPTANWYAVFLTLVIVAVLAWWPAARRGHWETVGLLLATLFLFRQLSGVIVAMGVVAYLLASIDGPGSRRLARAIVAILIAGLCLYLWQKGSASGLMLIGLWPLLMLVRIAQTTQAGDRAVAIAIERIALGGVIGLIPMVLFHLAQGSLATWFDDTMLTAFRLTELPFVAGPRHITVAMLSVLALFTGDVVAAANALHWLVLLAAPVIVGVLTVTRWSTDPATRHPLVIVASFFAVTALHFQIPIYLTYISGMSLIALLWLTGSFAVRLQRTVVVVVCATAAVALIWQTAQPISRGIAGIVAGQTRSGSVQGLPSASVWIEPEQVRTYGRLLDLIDRHAPPGDPILALPMNPEIYFLSGRRAPVRFFTTALGVQTSAQVSQTLVQMATAPPAVIIHHRDDKYNTAPSNALLDSLRARYVLLQSVDGFDVYIPRTP